MLILNKADTSAALTHAACIELMRDTMKSVSQRDVVMPLRRFMEVPNTGGKLGLMPGYVGGSNSAFGVKIVSKFPRAPDSPYGSHVGAVMIFDCENGIPIALLDGGELTAIRTSAASALATDVLARPDARTLVLFGGGEQARHHIAAISEVRNIERVIVWGRSESRLEAFKDSISSTGLSVEVMTDGEAAASEADVLCTVTSSKEPILKGDWIKPGTHVNLVGAAVRTSAEADTTVVTCGKFYTDYLPSALDQAGELLTAIEHGEFSEQQIAGEIGEVLLGTKPGRTSSHEITVYKSLGVAAQDLAGGVGALSEATAQGIGITVPWEG